MKNPGLLRGLIFVKTGLGNQEAEMDLLIVLLIIVMAHIAMEAPLIADLLAEVAGSRHESK